MTRVAVLVLLLLSFAMALAESPADKSALVGVWRGKFDSLPAVSLTVDNEYGKLGGAVLFYLIRRKPGATPTASPGTPEPMLNLRFDGKTLAFEVSHRYAHPPRTLNDPPVEFRLEITGPDRAKLVSEEGLSCEMVRDKY
jgi:hypothetical protein